MSKQELLQKQNYCFEDLLEITEILRAPDGCPWDREQTHRSIRKALIEETYEAVEGVDLLDDEIMCEEFGDMLLQIVFHASIAKDRGAFDINKICDGVCKKLIYRHPHVFSDVKADTSEQVLKNWDELKKKEKKQKNVADELLSVSKALPSLMRAQKLIKKSGQNKSESDIVSELEASVKALKNASESKKNEALKEIVFACAGLSNTYKLDLEQEIYNKNDEFCNKFIKNI